VIGKWVYVDENLIFVDKAGEVLAVEPIRNIKKITFSSDEDMAVDNVSSETIVVYPNPTQDILMIKGVDYQTLRVYDMQGRLLKVESGSQINVSSLAEGTYLLQIGTQVVRFIKK
jgi:myo-inositol-hexaphosphate 3-phosphohydrolase